MPGIISVLKQADIFQNFTQTQLELLADLCEERSYHKGETIFLEDANSDELYLIAQGEVEILVSPSLPGSDWSTPGHDEADRKEMVIATLRHGQSFGEIALVDQGLRSATARAGKITTRLVVIPRKRLMTLCESYPQLGYRLMFNLAVDLALKIRSTDLKIREELLYSKRNR